MLKLLFSLWCLYAIGVASRVDNRKVPSKEARALMKRADETGVMPEFIGGKKFSQTTADSNGAMILCDVMSPKVTGMVLGDTYMECDKITGETTAKQFMYGNVADGNYTCAYHTESDDMKTSTGKVTFLVPDQVIPISTILTKKNDGSWIHQSIPSTTIDVVPDDYINEDAKNLLISMCSDGFENQFDGSFDPDQWALYTESEMFGSDHIESECSESNF